MGRSHSLSSSFLVFHRLVLGGVRLKKKAYLFPGGGSQNARMMAVLSMDVRLMTIASVIILCEC